MRQAFQGLPRFADKKSQHFTLPRLSLGCGESDWCRRGETFETLPGLLPNSCPLPGFALPGNYRHLGRINWNGVGPTIRTGFLDPSRGRFYIQKKTARSRSGKPRAYNLFQTNSISMGMPKRSLDK